MTLLLTDHPIPLRIDDHGTVRVGRTRVSLDSIVCEYQNGATAEQIADDFPVLELADIHAVISYYLRHPNEVEDYLANQQRNAEEVRRKIDPIVAKGNIRERLLARGAKRECTDGSGSD